MPIEVFAREEELAAIEGFLDRPTGGLRAMVLQGDAGIGKSTLWLAGVAAARQRGFTVLTSRPAEAESTLPNVVLGDLFGEVPPAALSSLPEPRRRAFESALLLRAADLPNDPRALGVAILTLLPALAGAGPLLLAIDDEQWTDTSSAATLQFALRRLQDQPIRLLLSRRELGGAPTSLTAALDPDVVEVLTVGPLSLGAIQLLLRRNLGTTFSRPTMARIHEVSGGNPFYALELARADAVGTARDAAGGLLIPPSLDLLLGARLTALSPPTMRALLLIAAQGRMPIGLTSAVGIDGQALAEATAAGVIETTDGVVRFAHPILASRLYQGATPLERRDVHQRLGSVIDDPVQRGRHLALATDEPQADLAAELESAAYTARDRGMPVAAAELADHAVRLTPNNAPADRHRRTLLTARAHNAAGDGNRARAIALDLVAAAPAGQARAEALVLRSELEPPGLAMALLDQALTEASGIPALEAAIHTGLAEAGFMSSTMGSAWEVRHALASLELAASLHDDALRTDALTTLAIVRFDLEAAEEACRLAVRLGNPRQVLRASSAKGHVLAWMGDTDRARAWLERQLQEWGDRDERARTDLLWYLALVELWAGRWAVGERHADAVLELIADYGLEVPYDRFPAALAALLQGRFEVARDYSLRALSLGEGQELEFYFGVLATCDLWSGEPRAALPSFLRAEQAADALGNGEPGMRPWRADYVEALLQVGRIEDAEDLADDWERTSKPLGRDRVLAEVARCRGLIAAARGDVAAAIGLLDAAAARHQVVGDPFGHARALLALGGARRRARQKRAARIAIEAALAEFEALGAPSWVAAARDELGRIGGRQRLEGLSPSELAVANLVAEGRTNHEIAAALFLGERTVAGHLTRIYAKLGIRSRTELAQLTSEGSPMSRTGVGNIETS